MNYYYNHQIKKHIVQFMEIFRGFEVKTGRTKDGIVKSIDVPVMYGSMDRVSAAIAAGNTQNQPMRLPVVSAYLRDINMASDRYKGVDTIKTMSYTPIGGVFPEDTKTISQVMPTPFKLSMELKIYSSNLDSQLQILEQVLILFNPSLQIQTSDALFDGGKITTVELTSISNEENFPAMGERRTIIHTLSFEFIVYLSAPAKIKDDRIRTIKLRIAKVDDTMDFDSIVLDDRLDPNKSAFDLTVLDTLI